MYCDFIVDDLTGEILHSASSDAPLSKETGVKADVGFSKKTYTMESEDGKFIRARDVMESVEFKAGKLAGKASPRRPVKNLKEMSI